MKCPKCGNNNTAGALFCGVCGNKITYNSFCPNCGSPLEPGAPFCGGCGNKLSPQIQPAHGAQNAIQKGLNEVDTATKAAGEGLQSAIDSIKQTTSKSINTLKGLVGNKQTPNMSTTADQPMPLPIIKSTTSITGGSDTHPIQPHLSPEPQQAKFCPKCGYPLNEGSTFCSVCNEDINTISSEPAIIHKPNVKKGLIHNRFNCPSCGIELKVKKKEERLFCSNCHAEIEKDGESYKLVPPKEKKAINPLPFIIGGGALAGLAVVCLIIAGIGNAVSSRSADDDSTSNYIARTVNMPAEEEDLLVAKDPVNEEEPSVAPTETPTPETEANNNNSETPNEISMPNSSDYYLGSNWNEQSLSEYFIGLGFSDIELISNIPSDNDYNTIITEMYIRSGKNGKWRQWDKDELCNKSDTIIICYNEILTIDNCIDFKNALSSEKNIFLNFSNKYNGKFVVFDAIVNTHLTYNSGIDHVIDVKQEGSIGASIVINEAFNNSIDYSVEEGDRVTVKGWIDNYQSEYYKTLCIKTVELKRQMGESITNNTIPDTTTLLAQSEEKIPSSDPTNTPTPLPTSTPTPLPTNTPTSAPTVTPIPISEPTVTPVPEPTATPVPAAPVAETKSYILNTNTMKFHKTTCADAKKIHAENRWDYTGTYQDVINMGYIPCKKCNPY